MLEENKQHLLEEAVLSNQLDKVADLLSHGADPNVKNTNELSPFIAAAANGLTSIFELILLHSPEVTQVNRFGGTALLPSSEKGFIEVVQLGIQAGVPVNHVNHLGWSALLEAVILGNDGFLYRDIVETLISGGADMTIQDYEKKTALMYATEHQKENILSVLKSKEDNSNFTTIKKLIKGRHYLASLLELHKLEESLEKIYYLGLVYERLHEFEVAKEYYEKGLENSPEFAYYLANLTKKLGDSDEVIAYFKQGANLTKGEPFYPYHLSNYFREIGHHEKAVEMMKELLRQSPTRVDYLFHLSNSLKALGDYQGASEILTKASNLQPQNKWLLKQKQLSEMRLGL